MEALNARISNLSLEDLQHLKSQLDLHLSKSDDTLIRAYYEPVQKRLNGKIDGLLKIKEGLKSAVGEREAASN